MKAYIEGDWGLAVRQFEKTTDFLPGYTDKPSKTLIGVMGDFDGLCPPDWKGYRELTDK